MTKKISSTLKEGNITAISREETMMKKLQSFTQVNKSPIKKQSTFKNPTNNQKHVQIEELKLLDA